MQSLVASTKSINFLNNTFVGGGAYQELSPSYYAPNGRDLRRRAEKANRKNAKKGIPPAPEGFFVKTLFEL